MSVTKLPTGQWAVTDADGAVISQHDTNSQAWRAAERASNEPINKREEISDWVFRRTAAGEGLTAPNRLPRIRKWKRGHR